MPSPPRWRRCRRGWRMFPDIWMTRCGMPARPSRAQLPGRRSWLRPPISSPPPWRTSPGRLPRRVRPSARRRGPARKPRNGWRASGRRQRDRSGRGPDRGDRLPHEPSGPQRDDRGRARRGGRTRLRGRGAGSEGPRAADLCGTEEIAGRIASIQSYAGEGSASVRSLAARLTAVEHAASSVATAVEQQDAPCRKSPAWPPSWPWMPRAPPAQPPRRCPSHSRPSPPPRVSRTCRIGWKEARRVFAAATETFVRDVRAA